MKAHRSEGKVDGYRIGEFAGIDVHSSGRVRQAGQFSATSKRLPGVLFCKCLTECIESGMGCRNSSQLDLRNASRLLSSVRDDVANQTTEPSPGS